MFFSANAITFSPISFALAFSAGMLALRHTAAPFLRGRHEIIEGLFTCSTLCSASLRISIRISKFTVQLLNIIISSRL